MRAITSRSRGKSLLLGLQFLFVLALIWVVGLGLWSAANGQSEAQDLVPSEVGGQRLVQLITGPQALAEIERLHDQDMGLLSAWVGHYQGRAMIWVGVAADVEEAEELLAAMTRQIQEGTPNFVHEGESKIAGLTVHRARGWGQLNYYYQKGSKVVWMAAPPGAENAFLAAAIERVQG